MKFNPTLPLAVALSFGIAGAALAQTATTETPTATPSTAYPQPQAATTETPTATPSTAYSQPQAAPTAASETEAQTNPMQPAAGRTPSATERTRSATAERSAQPPSTRMAPNGNETVRYAQYRLHAAGLYNGPQDGVMDPNTRAAIARYQEQNGLQRSESIDASTLASLESSQATGFGSTNSSNNAMPASASNMPPKPYEGAMGGNAGKASAR